MAQMGEHERGSVDVTASPGAPQPHASESIFPALPCAWAGCEEDARWVAVETHFFSLLFRQSAAVLCDRHAREAEHDGAAVVLSFKAFGAAARGEHLGADATATAPAGSDPENASGREPR